MVTNLSVVVVIDRERDSQRRNIDRLVREDQPQVPMKPRICRFKHFVREASEYFVD